jgi:glycosyltransferase involved in cell wall biosynthesis
MVLLEAMYFGTPVITSWNGGSSTLLTDESCGQVVKEFDALKWADAICRYLDDEEYSAKVSANAQKLIRENYSWDVIVAKMLDELDKR